MTRPLFTARALTIPGGYRSLWLGLGWVLAWWAMWQGISYTITDNDQVYSPSLYVLAHEVPGGMRTHGVIMIALALALAYALQASTLKVRRVIFLVFCGYCAFVTVCVFGSWWVTGRVVLAAPAFWAAVAVITGLMLIYPPQPLGNDGSEDA